MNKLHDYVEINPKTKLSKGCAYSFIEMKDLLPNNKFVTSKEKKIYKGAGSKFQKGDTLFARITPCLENGKTSQFIPEKFEEGFGSSEFIVLREKKGKSLNDYIYYLSKTNQFREYAIQNMIGTSGRQRVPNQVIASFEHSFPSIKVQEKIIRILNSLDNKIQLNLSINETYEDIAKTLFKSWFIDFDPVKAKVEDRSTGLPDEISALFPNSFEKSELGPIPRSWEIQSLGSVSKLSSGKRPKSRSSSKTHLSKYPLYGGAGPIGFANEFLLEGRKVITTGRVGTLGKFFRIRDPAWISDNALIIEPLDHVYNYCFYKLLNFDITIFNRGSTQPLITQSDLKTIEVICADVKIHKLFERICSSFFEQSEKNQNESNILANMRDYLLTKLIFGELRITEAEKIIEEVGI